METIKLTLRYDEGKILLAERVCYEIRRLSKQYNEAWRIYSDTPSSKNLKQANKLFNDFEMFHPPDLPIPAAPPHGTSVQRRDLTKKNSVFIKQGSVSIHEKGFNQSLPRGKWVPYKSIQKELNDDIEQFKEAKSEAKRKQIKDKVANRFYCTPPVKGTLDTNSH